ncbi:MAG TPA: ABC transporter permease [Vicinamibacterales bacterium]|nr:ABC transporter permease [Vicinamibacterales bacterium]
MNSSDLRHAWRTLTATPIVSTMAVLSLALGIGANTAMFSLLNTLMLRALPVHEPQRLVQVLAGTTRGSWTNPLWEQLRARDPQLFEGAFAFSSQQFNLASGGEAQPVNGTMASGGYFDVLGVHAILGRTFTPADDVRRGGKDGPIAVISYAFWQRHFRGAADVVGRSILLDRVSFRIIGVTPPSFTGLAQGRPFDVAVPIGVEPLMRAAGESALDERSWWWLRVMARLKPGQTIDQATHALRGVQPQMRQATIPPNYRPQDLPRYLSEGFTLRAAANGPASLERQYRQPLLTLMAVVVLVLLIACANIANLQLARAAARRHELSVRAALGASGWRLARQLLTESLVLSGGGALLGLVFAAWGGRLLVRQLSTATDTVRLDLPLDWRVLGFTAAVGIGTAVLFGIVPALRARRAQPNDALKEQGRAVVGEGRGSFGNLLVVAQVALSLVLVVGAGLFVRTFARLAHVELGFQPGPVLVVDADAKRSTTDAAALPALYERIRENLATMPGVTHAAASAITPLSNSIWDTLIENPAGLSLPEKDRDVHMNLVTPSWFATYGTRIVAGRDITTRDTASAPHVILVNETLARKYFAHRNPLGQTLRTVGEPGKPEPSLEIVGVVEDAVYDSLRDPVPPTMYQPLLQASRPQTQVSFSVRSASGSPALLTRAVTEAIGRIDPNLSLTFRPLAADIRAATTQERILAMLSGFFGALALLLAGLGLYGVMSSAVNRRRTEIGIRMALGARPGGAIALVLRRVALLVAAGIVAGALVSLWAAHFTAALLFGLEPRDPLTLAGAALVLVLVGALAAWLPARRAAHIDPARVLRQS